MDLEHPILVRETVFTSYGPIDMFHPPEERLQGHTASEDSMLLIPPPGLTCNQAFASFITNETFQTLFRGFRIVGVGLPFSDSECPPIMLNQNTLPLIPSEFTFAKRIGDALQQIRMFPTIVVSVGPSIGIAQTLAFEAPIMVRSIVAIGPPPPPSRVNRLKNGLGNWMLRKFSGDLLPDHYIESTLGDWFGSKTLQRNRTRYNAFEHILENVHPSNMAIGMRLVNSRRDYLSMQVKQPVLIIQGSETPFEKTMDPFFISRNDTRMEHVHMCGRLSHLESPSFVALCIKDHLNHMNPPKVPSMSVAARMEEEAEIRLSKDQIDKEKQVPAATQTPESLLKRMEEQKTKFRPVLDVLQEPGESGFGGADMESNRTLHDEKGNLLAPGA